MTHITMEVDTSLIKKKKAKMREIGHKLVELLKESTFITKGEVKEETPKKTGHLRANLSHIFTLPDSALIFPDFKAAPYARDVIKGYQPLATPGQRRWYWWHYHNRWGRKHPKRRTGGAPGSRVKSRPYLDWGVDRAEFKVQEEVNRFGEWLSEL